MRIKKLVALGLSLVVLVNVVFNLELSSPKLPDVYAADSTAGNWFGNVDSATGPEGGGSVHLGSQGAILRVSARLIRRAIVKEGFGVSKVYPVDEAESLILMPPNCSEAGMKEVSWAQTDNNLWKKPLDVNANFATGNDGSLKGIVWQLFVGHLNNYKGSNLANSSGDSVTGLGSITYADMGILESDWDQLVKFAQKDGDTSPLTQARLTWDASIIDKPARVKAECAVGALVLAAALNKHTDAHFNMADVVAAIMRGENYDDGNYFVISYQNMFSLYFVNQNNVSSSAWTLPQSVADIVLGKHVWNDNTMTVLLRNPAVYVYTSTDNGVRGARVWETSAMKQAFHQFYAGHLAMNAMARRLYYKRPEQLDSENKLMWKAEYSDAGATDAEQSMWNLGVTIAFIGNEGVIRKGPGKHQLYVREDETSGVEVELELIPTIGDEVTAITAIDFKQGTPEELSPEAMVDLLGNFKIGLSKMTVWPVNLELTRLEWWTGARAQGVQFDRWEPIDFEGGSATGGGPPLSTMNATKEVNRTFWIMSPADIDDVIAGEIYPFLWNELGGVDYTNFAKTTLDSYPGGAGTWKYDSQAKLFWTLNGGEPESDDPTNPDRQINPISLENSHAEVIIQPNALYSLTNSRMNGNPVGRKSLKSVEFRAYPRDALISCLDKSDIIYINE